MSRELGTVEPFGPASVMIPSSFQAAYPSLAAALSTMRATTAEEASSSPASSQDDVARQLAIWCRSREPLDEVADALLANVAEPEREMTRLSKSAYRLLGVSDDVRVFIGSLWAAAMRSWNSNQRAIFLRLTVEDRHDAFAALDFAAELFKRVTFTATEMLPWLKHARLQVGNDLMQHGLWNSVQAFCKTSPTQAIRLAMAWLDDRPDAQSLATIANITGWVRLELSDNADAAAELTALESRLRTSGNPAWRSAYIQSWARDLEQGSLTREKVRALFDEFVTKDSDEEVAWCYLLYAIVQRESVTANEWSWISEELRRPARTGLTSAPQHWIVLTILKGLTESTKKSTAVSDWLDLFQISCPIPSANQHTWSQITAALVNLMKSAPEVMRALAMTLVTHSGREWLECEDRNEFRWFLMELANHDQHTLLASQLCFAPGVHCRRLGLRVFSECSAPTLEPGTVRTVSASQIELLLLEARRFHVDYAALARLHASLAARIDQLGAEFLELLYDEVSRQCRNTYAYRAALRAAAPDNEYLMAIADDSEQRMKETHEASVSPALQMDVPGYARARRLHDRYVAGQVAKSVAEKSIFLKLVRKVQLLYSAEKWRYFNPDGSLSESSEFHRSSAEIEVPRLEISNPEEAQMRRLQASVRIAQLEQQTNGSSDE